MVQKHTNFRIILNCATHKGNFRANFFFSDKKKPLAQLAHPYFGLKVLGLANNSVPRALAQLGTNGVFTSFFALLVWHSQISIGIQHFFKMYSAREGIFGFGKNNFA